MRTRDALVEVFGEVTASWERLIERDPVFAEAYARYLHALVIGAEFTARERELLLLAHDVSITVLDEDGVQRRVRRALKAGASEDDVLAVIELTTFIALHGLTVGLPLAADLPEGRPADQRGTYWDEFERIFPGVGLGMQTHLPEVYDAYRAVGAVLWSKGLEPWLRELVLVVGDLTNQHLFTPGARLHIRQARHDGATEAQVIAAIALTAADGHRSLALGLPALDTATRAPAVRDPAGAGS